MTKRVRRCVYSLYAAPEIVSGGQWKMFVTEISGYILPDVQFRRHDKIETGRIEIKGARRETHERNAANRTHFSFSHFFPQLSMAAAGDRKYFSCLFFHQYHYSQNCRRIYCCRPNRCCKFCLKTTKRRISRLR